MCNFSYPAGFRILAANLFAFFYFILDYYRLILVFLIMWIESVNKFKYPLLKNMLHNKIFVKSQYYLQN
jgi:hypothetical protein